MKYIKTFESVNKKFWKVRTFEPYFTISLQKLGLTDDDIQTFYNEMNQNHIKQHSFIYVFYHIKPGREIGDWVYSTDFLNDDNFSFMGGVDITKEDIDKYNIKKDANKFNL